MRPQAPDYSPVQREAAGWLGRGQQLSDASQNLTTCMHTSLGGRAALPPPNPRHVAEPLVPSGLARVPWPDRGHPPPPLPRTGRRWPAGPTAGGGPGEAAVCRVPRPEQRRPHGRTDHAGVVGVPFPICLNSSLQHRRRGSQSWGGPSSKEGLAQGPGWAPRLPTAP